MATVSGSSTSSYSIYNQLTASNKGIGGLVSGLDTDSLVEALTMGTRSKIAAQNQQKTLLTWKMGAYRSIATAMRAFQNKYVSTNASKTYLGSYSFWNVNKATASSDAVSVTAGSSASAGSFNINAITSVATSQSISTKQYTHALESAEAFDYTSEDYIGKFMKLSFNGTTKTIKLDTLNGMTSPTDFEDELQALIDNAFGSNMIDVSVDASGSLHTVTLDGGTASLIITNSVDTLGFTTANMGNRLPTGTLVKDMKFAGPMTHDTFTFRINGVDFTYTTETAMSTITREVTNSTAGVKMEWDSVTQTYVFTAKATGAGDNIVMEDVTGNFLNQLVGVRGGNTITSPVIYTDASQSVNITSNSPKDLMSIINAITVDPTKDLDDLQKELGGYLFDFYVDGKRQVLSLGFSKDDLPVGYTDSDIAAAVVKNLNDQIASKYGSSIAVDVKFTLTGTTLSFASTNDHSIKFEARGVDPTDQVGNALEALGLAASENSIIQQYSLTVTGTGTSDYETWYKTASNDGQTFTMNVTINGQTESIEVTIDRASLEPSISGKWTDENGDVHTYTTQQELEDAIDALELETPPDEDQIDKLKEILQDYKDTYDDRLKQNIQNDLQKQLNASLQEAFKDTDAESAAKFSFTVTAEGKVTLTSTDPTIAFEVTQNNSTYDLLAKLGFSSAGQANGRGTLLSDIPGINVSSTQTLEFYMGDDGYDSPPTVTFSIQYGSGDTIQDIINKINDAYGRDIAKFQDGKIVFSGNSQAMGFSDSGTLTTALFGVNSFETIEATGAYTENKGTNAQIIIDEQLINSTTNTINYKGVTIEIDRLFNWVDGSNIEYDTVTGLFDFTETQKAFTDPTDNITIRVSSDVDAVVDGIKDFIEDYNTLIDLLYSTISEKKVSGYEPLTDEQKAEMSEKEIENWETEAKKGLLRSDSTLRSIMDQMRQVMYTKVDDNGIGIWDIGITTMSIFTTSGGTNYSNSGKLELNEDGEKLLRSMLETNVDLVRDLFNEETGLTAKLNKVFVDAVNEATGAQGSLVRLAGTETLTGDNESTLGKKITTIDEYIAKLKTRLESEYNRYWQKFASLETAISRMNAQMAYLDGLSS